MASVINHNIPSLNSQRYLGVNNRAADKAMQRLASGLRINSAADDAAGLAISEKMRGQIRGLSMAKKNAQDSSSLIQVAEGGLDQTQAILTRMRELAVQSANDTNTNDDRNAIENEIKQLKKEIDRIGNTTEFNTKKLLEGSVKGAKEAVKGRFDVNNNTAVTFSSSALDAALKQIQDAGLYDGTITIVRNSNVGSDIPDFKVIFSNGRATGGGSTEITGYASIGVAVTPGLGSNGFNTVAAAGSASGSVWVNGNTLAGVSITVTAGGIQIAGVASGAAVSIALDANSIKFNELAVGDSISFNFARAEKSSGSLDNSLMTQLGANTGQIMYTSIGDMRSRALGLEYTSVSTNAQAQAAITEIDNASIRVSDQRAMLGAIQNRLDYAINALEITGENVTAAESRIRDTDMASEMSNYSKENIKSQAAQSMVAQANARAQQVLSLLQ